MDETNIYLLLEELDAMLNSNSINDLCADEMFEKVSNLVDKIDRYDQMQNPIVGQQVVNVNLDRDVYLGLLIRARECGMVFNTYVVEVLKLFLVENLK